jgi:glutaredoxin
MTKEYLNNNKIEFTEYDVAADAAKRAEMIDISEQMGVPVTTIGDAVIVGFDRDEIAAQLGIGVSAPIAA